MRKRDIIIGAIYKLKNKYGLIIPRKIIDANAYSNPNPFAIVECKNVSDEHSVIMKIVNLRLSEFRKDNVVSARIV
jgi:hypothetical protein